MSKKTLTLFLSVALALNLAACGAPESDPNQATTQTPAVDELVSSTKPPTPALGPGYCQVAWNPYGQPYLTGKCQQVIPSCGSLVTSAVCPSGQVVTGDPIETRCERWVDLNKTCY